MLEKERDMQSSKYFLLLGSGIVLISGLVLLSVRGTHSQPPQTPQIIRNIDEPARNATQYIFTAVNTPTNTNPNPTVWTAGIPVGKRLVIEHLEITSVARTSIA